MSLFKTIANQWYDVVCRDEFAEYRDVWIADELFFQLLQSHCPTLVSQYNEKYSRKNFNTAILRIFEGCESLDNQTGVYRHEYSIFCPFDQKKRKVFYKVSKEKKHAHLPEQEEMEAAFRPRKRRSDRISQFNSSDSQRRRVEADADANNVDIHDEHDKGDEEEDEIFVERCDDIFELPDDDSSSSDSETED